MTSASVAAIKRRLKVSSRAYRRLTDVGVLSNLLSFLFKEPSSVLKGGVKVCQQQLVNELLGPLVTEFVRNFSREDATPYQRGSNGSLLGRI